MRAKAASRARESVLFLPADVRTRLLGAEVDLDSVTVDEHDALVDKLLARDVCVGELEHGFDWEVGCHFIIGSVDVVWCRAVPTRLLELQTPDRIMGHGDLGEGLEECKLIADKPPDALRSSHAEIVPRISVR